jgi:pimeloyl-ACP methyl ester carboxylesterase
MSGGEGRGRRWPRWVAAVAAAGVVLVLLPPVQARAKAAAVLADALDLGTPRPLAAEVTRQGVTVGGVAGELYAPRRPAPPVLLVPGATPAGLRDRRIVRVAEAYARAGRAVFVPDLALYEERFEEADIEALVRAALGLAERDGARGGVTVLGFSYGGAFALVAAADPRLADAVEHIGVFGAYHDLVGVIQAATTGVSLVGTETIPWEAHPAAGQVLREHAVGLAPPDQRAALGAALDSRLDPGELPAEARAIHALVVNPDPARTFPLAEELPADVRARLARFSPASVAERVTAPVSVLHSTDDPLVPYGEALRLTEALPHARLYTVELFRHVDYRPDGAGEAIAVAADLVRTWRFAGRLLGAQERTLSLTARAPTPPAPAPTPACRSTPAPPPRCPMHRCRSRSD